MGQGVASVFLFGFVFLFFSGLINIIKHIVFSSSDNRKCSATISKINSVNEKRPKADVSLIINMDGLEHTIPHFTFFCDSKNNLEVGTSVEVIWNMKKQKAIYANTLQEGIKKIIGAFGCLVAFALITILVVYVFE